MTFPVRRALCATPATTIPTSPSSPRSRSPSCSPSPWALPTDRSRTPGDKEALGRGVRVRCQWCTARRGRRQCDGSPHVDRGTQRGRPWPAVLPASWRSSTWLRCHLLGTPHGDRRSTLTESKPAAFASDSTDGGGDAREMGRQRLVGMTAGDGRRRRSARGVRGRVPRRHLVDDRRDVVASPRHRARMDQRALRRVARADVGQPARALTP